MRKIITLLSVLSLMGAGCQSQSTTPVKAPAPTPVPAPAAPQAPASAPASDTSGQNLKVNAQVEVYPVTIQNFAFSPAAITVGKGDKVTFTNKDGMGHTVTADNGAFSSTVIASGTSYTLDTSTLAPGTYAFHCSIHPSMTGTLNVQ